MMAPGIFPYRQPGDEQEPRRREPCLRFRQIAEGDEGGRIAGDHAGILQRDQRQEEADAGGDAELQTHGDGVDQPGAQRRQRQEKEQHAGHEHAAERELPVAAQLGHDGEGEIGVEAHARGERDRIIGVKPHDERSRGGGEAGGDEHGAVVHPGFFQDRRVDEHDVGHGQEGGETGAKLGADARS